MKWIATIICVAAIGCSKKSELTSEEQATWKRYAEMACECKDGHCQPPATPNLAKPKDQYDDASQAFITKMYETASDCRLAGWKAASQAK